MSRGACASVVALVASLLVLGASPPALAHACADEPTIVEGVDTTIEVGVAVSEQPAEVFAVIFDETFEVVDAQRSGRWVPSLRESAIEYTGGTLEPGSCVVFDVTVNASEPGTFRVRTPQLTADGSAVESPPDGDFFTQPDGSLVRVDRSGPPNPVFEQVIEVTPAEERSTARWLFAGLFLLVGIAVAWLWRTRSRALGGR